MIIPFLQRDSTSQVGTGVGEEIGGYVVPTPRATGGDARRLLLPALMANVSPISHPNDSTIQPEETVLEVISELVRLDASVQAGVSVNVSGNGVSDAGFSLSMNDSTLATLEAAANGIFECTHTLQGPEAPAGPAHSSTPAPPHICIPASAAVLPPLPRQSRVSFFI